MVVWFVCGGLVGKEGGGRLRVGSGFFLFFLL